jgi:hypothetical protein
MRLRNIGIVGYVGVFLIVAALLAVLFYGTAPREASRAQRSEMVSLEVHRDLKQIRRVLPVSGHFRARHVCRSPAAHRDN